MNLDNDQFQSSDWNNAIQNLPGAHILQTTQWGQVKSNYGWLPIPQIWRAKNGEVEAAALVLHRAIKIPGFSSTLGVMYVPKGPLLDWGNESLRQRVLGELINLARQNKAIFIKIDPDLRLGSGIPGDQDATEDLTGNKVVAHLAASGWRYSTDQIQFRNTVLIDLEPDPDQLLANMKQKTRYNIRLAERKGVVIRVGGLEDLDTLYRIYAETAVRDGFVIRTPDYYKTLWSTFIKKGMAEPLLAEVDGCLSAALVIFRFAGKAWYIHGMSLPYARKKMPNHLLQWVAMLRAKEAGCTVYDLWGAPEVFDQSDPLWGVFRFKDGLGGRVVRYLGAWDYPVQPVFYPLYTQVLPRILDLMRRRGEDRTRRMVST